MTKTLVVIATLIAATPTAAHAQWTLKPFAGVNFGSKHGFVDLDDAAGRMQPTFGAAVGRELSAAWGVDVEFATSPKFLKGDSGLIESGRVDTFFANASWRLGRITSGFHPYLTAGLGVARVTVDDVLGAFSSTSNLGALNFGGGILVGTSARVRLIADVKYVRSQYGDAGHAGLGDEYVAFWRTSGGVLLRF